MASLDKYYSNSKRRIEHATSTFVVFEVYLLTTRGTGDIHRHTNKRTWRACSFGFRAYKVQQRQQQDRRDYRLPLWLAKYTILPLATPNELCDVKYRRQLQHPYHGAAAGKYMVLRAAMSGKKNATPLNARNPRLCLIGPACRPTLTYLGVS